MTNIRDLMTVMDAMEMEDRYASAYREHNRQATDFDIRDLLERRPFDWEVDVPEFGV